VALYKLKHLTLLWVICF